MLIDVGMVVASIVGQFSGYGLVVGSGKCLTVLVSDFYEADGLRSYLCVERAHVKYVRDRVLFKHARRIFDQLPDSKLLPCPECDYPMPVTLVTPERTYYVRCGACGHESRRGERWVVKRQWNSHECREDVATVRLILKYGDLTVAVNHKSVNMQVALKHMKLSSEVRNALREFVK